MKTVKMHLAWLVLLFLTCLFPQPLHAALQNVDAAFLARLESEPGLATPWLLYIVDVEDVRKSETQKIKNELEDLSSLLPESIVRCGLFIVDSIEKIQLARLYSFKAQQLVLFRPHSWRIPNPRAKVYTRPAPHFLRSHISAATFRLSTMVDLVLKETAPHYYHPVTLQLIPSVHYILHPSHLDQLVDALRPPSSDHDVPQLTTTIPFGPNPTLVLLYFPLLQKASIKLHAELQALGAQLGTRLILCATDDADVASIFNLHELYTGVALPFKELPRDENYFADLVASRVTLLSKQNASSSTMSSTNSQNFTFTSLVTLDDIQSPGRVSTAVAPHVLAEKEWTSLVDGLRQTWAEEVSAYMTSSPLRQLSRTEDFEREVFEWKQGVRVLFVLRESDTFFHKHFKTAVEFAQMIRDRDLPGSKKNKLSSSFQFDVYWMDGEKHPEATRAMGVARVPSILLLMHLNTAEGDPNASKSVACKAAEFSEEEKENRAKYGKETEWMSADELLAYVSSSKLTELRGDTPRIGLHDVQFSARVVERVHTNKNNRRYFVLDCRHYAQNVTKSTFIADLLDGKIQEEVPQSGSSAQKKERKKKTKKERQREKKIAEDIASRAEQRAQRMKEKVERDAALREKIAEQTRAQQQEKSVEERKKNKLKRRWEKLKPHLDPNRPPKDFKTTKEKLFEDLKKGMQIFIRGKGEKVRLFKGLSTRLSGWNTQEASAKKSDLLDENL